MGKSVTEHKNAQSLKSYERSTEKELRAIAEILDKSVSGPGGDEKPAAELLKVHVLETSNLRSTMSSTR